MDVERSPEIEERTMMEISGGCENREMVPDLRRYTTRGVENDAATATKLSKQHILYTSPPFPGPYPLSPPPKLFSGGVVSRPSRHDCFSTLRQPQAIVALAPQTAFSSPGHPPGDV